MAQQGRPRRDCSSGFLQALGDLVVASGQLEYIVALSIKRMLRKPLTEGLQIAEQQGSFKSQRKTIRQQFVGDYPSDKSAQSKLDRLLNDIADAFDQRDRHIHSTAVYLEKDQSVRRLAKSRRGVRELDIGYDVKTLNSLRDDMRRLYDDLNSFTAHWYLSR